ncbi:hypothetical protein AB0H76_12020 [Nocardia sp. NPDC050712]|uniref:hypothetical protein n=1 Tax=Nocardia sp. NPDC050712 TaxID=3155518 RepID=UPI0033DDA0DB
MTAIRVLLALSGLGLAWYGIDLFLDFTTTDLISVAFWFAGGILLHDAVFAPLCAAVGLAAHRLLPESWWGPALVGTVCTVTLLALAVPVLGRAGDAANPTVLDRNYGLGLVLAIAVVWILVGLAVVVSRRFRAAEPDDSAQA